ncbi:cell wall surface anchor family protein [Rhodotorula toruloides]|uniref:Cell wall surface anchor family protein n=1 Tax=Rhodotorula toruloides TaxID=5286 RepID=A0A511K8K8_RHOTO|nr:cell wall surface anchor family protein [Rhodotorula toruloides]
MTAHLARQSATNSPSPPRLRMRTGGLLAAGSKLRKRVAESDRRTRFFGSSVRIDGQEKEVLAAESVERGSRTSTDSRSIAESASLRIAERLEEAESWFDERDPVGGLGRQPYRRDGPYFVSYAHESLDWDALVTSTLYHSRLEGSPAFASISSTPHPVPKRVLDIGCGTTPFWILEMASKEGWEKTEFVGLDIAPSSVTIDLPADVASRISFIQTSFSNSLPFRAEFDYVRVTHVGLALQGLLEVVEQDHSTWLPQPNPSTPSFSRPSSTLMDDIFTQAFRANFINPRPLSVLPANFAMSGTSFSSTGRITLPLSPSSASHSTSNVARLTADGVQAPLLSKYVPGRASRTILREQDTRIFLHAYANRWASSSYGLADAALAEKQKEALSSTLRRAPSGDTQSVESSHHVTRQHDSERLELQGRVHDWAADLRDRADLASLLTSRLNWQPTFDHALLSALETNLPIYEKQLEVLERKKEMAMDVFGEVEAEEESRIAQVKSARREVEAEIAAVQRRLGLGRHTGVEDVLGALEMEVFVAKVDG